MYVKETILKKVDDIALVVKPSNKDQHLMDKDIFTIQELDYCAKRIRCLGARLMIKECVFDYLTSQLGQIEKNYREIEIVNDEYRKPALRLFDGIGDYARKLNIKNIHISVSHSRRWITGIVLFCYDTSSV